MKVFLFLYPIEQYFTSTSNAHVLRRIRQRGLSVSYLNDIIHERYRKEKYQVVWMLFGNLTDIRIPDRSSLSHYIHTQDGDIFVSSGVAYEGTAGHQPNPEFVLSQLPSKITHLVLGGFHQWDCVDKMGRFAYELRIPVIVDEDTTDHFLLAMSRFGKIPLLRPLHAAVDNVMKKNGLATREMIVQQRSEKPWFAQPTVR